MLHRSTPHPDRLKGGTLSMVLSRSFSPSSVPTLSFLHGVFARFSRKCDEHCISRPKAALGRLSEEGEHDCCIAARPIPAKGRDSLSRSLLRFLGEQSGVKVTEGENEIRNSALLPHERWKPPSARLRSGREAATRRSVHRS
jgi:hypothetical protein